MSTDSEIIARSVDDPEAFAEIFERHVRIIGGYIGRRLGADAVDDVLSETFLVAFARRTAFDHEWDSALPWLFGISSRLMRKHRAREMKQLRSAMASAAREEFISHDGIDAANGRLDAESAARELGPRIASLNAADRETLLLYAWADQTYEEVALALGVPVGTVRSRLNRVRRRLDPHRSNRMSAATTKEGENDGRVGSRA